MSLPVSGFVLTGGRSSRMGTDKALLPFRGGLLGAHVASVMEQVCGPVKVIGDPVPHAPLARPVLPDLRASIGPLGGIEAALAASSTPWILVAACDMPALTPEFLASLIRVAEKETMSDPADAFLPIPPGGPSNPLCALYHRRILPRIREAIATGDYKVTRALNGTQMRLIAVDDGAPLRNANTPDEWQELLKSLPELEG